MAGVLAASRRAAARLLLVRGVGLAVDDGTGNAIGGAAVSVEVVSRLGTGDASGFAAVAGTIGAMSLAMVFTAGGTEALGAVVGSLVLMGSVAVEAGAGIFFSDGAFSPIGFSLGVNAERCRYA